MRRAWLALIILVALTACNGKSNSNSQDAAATTDVAAVTTPVPPVPVGTAAKWGNVSLTVDKVSTPDKTPDDTLQSGYHWVVLDVSVKNDYDVPLPVGVDLRWKLQDAQGQTYDEDLAAPLTQSMLEDVTAHDNGSGSVGFQVKDGATGLLLVAEVQKPTGGAGNIFDPTVMANAIATMTAHPEDLDIGVVQIDLGL